MKAENNRSFTID